MTPSRLEVTVGWGDCDPALIVFYPRYFYWFDVATVHLLDGLGLDLAALVDGQGLLRMPVVDSGATFRRPSRLGDRLTIESVLERHGRSSFRVTHAVSNGGERALEGHEVRAWVVPDGERPGAVRSAALPAAVALAFDAAGSRGR